MFPIKDTNEVFVCYIFKIKRRTSQIGYKKNGIECCKQKFILAQTSVVLEVAINVECLWLKFQILIQFARLKPTHELMNS